MKYDTDKILELFSNCIFEEFTDDVIRSNVLDELKEDCSEFDCGATKLVLWFASIPDYVIKIPFNGYVIGKYDEYTDKWNDTYIPFKGADGKWDYCQREVSLYAKAKEKNVDMFFLETILVGEVDNHPIYIQKEGEDYYYKDHEDLSYDEIANSKALCRDAGVPCLKENWILDAIQCYGLLKVKEFLKFIHDNKINDLHSNNLGYYENKPIIIDYAGYDY